MITHILASCLKQSEISSYLSLTSIRIKHLKEADLRLQAKFKAPFFYWNLKEADLKLLSKPLFLSNFMYTPMQLSYKAQTAHCKEA